MKFINYLIIICSDKVQFFSKFFHWMEFYHRGIELVLEAKKFDENKDYENSFDKYVQGLEYLIVFSILIF
jgi:hypothetical protein